MTVSSSTNKVSYSGNGSLTTFAYSFKIFDQGDLTVILRAADGTETTQTITTHYTVSGVGSASGGNVVFGSAPASGVTVVIIREQPLTQGLDLVANDPFPAGSLEEALDKLTFMSQKHEEELGRAIKASRTNTLTGSEFTVSATDRANKVFSFDSAGDLAVTQELGTFKGDWAASTAYVERDLVKDTSTNNVFIVNAAHTSSGSQPLTTNTNSSKYEKIIDVTNPPGDLTVGDDLTLASDAAVLGFGADTDVTLTHVADTGLLLNSTRQLQFNDASQYINAPNATTLDINATDEIELNATLIDVNGNLEVSGTITLGSGAVISEAELEALDDVTAGTVAASKAVIVDSNKDIASFRNLTATGAITGGSFVIGSADINENDLEAIDGVTAGTVAASKAVVVDTNKDISSFRNLTASGTMTYGSLSDGSITITAFVDEDNMSSNSATLVPTQQSVKAYVDAQVATADTWAEVLANGNTTGSTDAVISSGQKLTTNTIDETTSGTGVTIDSVVLKDNIVTASAITLTSGGAFRSTVDNGSVALSGGNNSNVGSNIILYGSSHASLPNDIKIRRSGVDFALFDGATGDISFYEDTGSTVKFFWDASTERLGIGTATVDQKIHLEESDTTSVFLKTQNSAGALLVGNNSSGNSFVSSQTSGKPLLFETENTERMRIDNSGKIGIGTTAPANLFVVAEGTNQHGIELAPGTTSYIQAYDRATSDYGDLKIDAQTLAFGTDNGVTKMSIDASGNVSVTGSLGVDDITIDGSTISDSGDLIVDVGGNLHLDAAGHNITFKDAGTEFGKIAKNGDNLELQATANLSLRPNGGTSHQTNSIVWAQANIKPWQDDYFDLGSASYRWDDIYATNGTIQTSDRNEKQDIAELTDAEQRVAVAAKGLLRKFRWKTAVVEKGDEARTHFGIIAQDLQAAFAAEGLDAGDYAMFISTTWWETQTEVAAVEAVEAQDAVYNEDGELVTEAVEAVEAKEAYTRIDTYNSEEEAPEGATEKTRMGVRYSELLAFIIAAI